VRPSTENYNGLEKKVVPKWMKWAGQALDDGYVTARESKITGFVGESSFPDCAQVKITQIP
jgi:hypothetical protein